MITALTSKQEKKLDFYRDKWLKIGLDTSRIKRPLATKIIKSLYGRVLLYPKNPLIVYVDNPRDAYLASCMIYSMLSDKKEHVY